MSTTSGNGPALHTRAVTYWLELIIALAAMGVALAGWLLRYRWVQRGVVGPKAWPLIGALPEIVKNWDRLQDWLTHYLHRTRVLRIPLGFSKEGLFIADPVCVEYLLKTNFSNYPKGPINAENHQELLGDGIFNVDGLKWKEQRRAAGSEFTSSVLREFSLHVFREYALKLVVILAQNAHSSEPVDLQDLMMRMTLDTTCQVGFGVQLSCLSPSLPQNPFAVSFENANAISFSRFVDPLWKVKRLLSVGKERELKHHIRGLDTFTYNVIRQRREELAVAEVMGRPKTHKLDLLSRFMTLSSEGKENLTDRYLRDIILNFIVAGRDTTAITLSWFFYLLSLHPMVAERAFEEVSLIEHHNSLSLTDDKTEMASELWEDKERFAAFAENLTYESLGKLNYLQAALAETLRLYPPVPLDAKYAVADDTLPDGTRVNKGSIVAFCPYAMGRMEYIWGPNALEFKPERWLKHGVFQLQSPFKFTAFQAGPRICLGKDSAYLQMKITAALLLRFFQFQLLPGHPVLYRTMVILTMMHGLKVTVSERTF